MVAARAKRRKRRKKTTCLRSSKMKLPDLAVKFGRLNKLRPKWPKKIATNLTLRAKSSKRAIAVRKTKKPRNPRSRKVKVRINKNSFKL